MRFSFLPRLLAPALTSLTPEFLSARGIRLLMLDFDNTIVPYTTSVPTEEMAAWLGRIRQSELAVCVVSNSKKPRVVAFCQKYGISCITHAKKPFSGRALPNLAAARRTAPWWGTRSLPILLEPTARGCTPFSFPPLTIIRSG